MMNRMQAARLLLATAFAAVLILPMVGCQPSAGEPEGQLPDPSPTEGTPRGEDVETAAVTLTPEKTMAVPPTATPESEPGPTREPTGVVASTHPEAARLAQLAGEDLSTWLGVPAEEITVKSIEAVEWPDASLGCPLPGMAYAQVATPGYRVLLQVEDRLYDYRADSEQRVVLCEEEEMTDLLGNASPAEADQARAVRAASEDLARRLSIAVDQITLLEVRDVTWPDSSLGCAQPGETYQQVPEDGLLIRLGAGGNMYFYHSGASGEPFLCEGTSQMIPQVIPKDDELVPPPDWEID